MQEVVYFCVTQWSVSMRQNLMFFTLGLCSSYNLHLCRQSTSVSCSWGQRDGFWAKICHSWWQTCHCGISRCCISSVCQCCVQFGHCWSSCNVSHAILLRSSIADIFCCLDWIAPGHNLSEELSISQECASTDDSFTYVHVLVTFAVAHNLNVQTL